MSSTSATALIASVIKDTLDGYNLTRISEPPTITVVKHYVVELSKMAAAIESNRTGGMYGHMYLVLEEDEYRIATGEPTANVTLLTKPEDVNPTFKTEKKEDLTSYRIRQLEAETLKQKVSYHTQQETSKELVRRMVASIDAEYIEELENEYTGYNNETPKSILQHLASEYCTATIKDKLGSVAEFEKAWDQVVPLGTWIMRLEQLRRKCKETGINIDDNRMVLKIAENAMKCAVFTQLDHEGYDELTDHKLDTVTKFWVKKYKAHTKFTRDQAGTNAYESAAYTVLPPSGAITIDDWQ